MIKKLLAVMPSNLGDVVLAMPVVSAFVNKYGGLCVDFVARHKVYRFMENLPVTDKVFLYNRSDNLLKKAKFILEIRRYGHDFVLDFRNSLIPYFLGVPSKSLYLNAVIARIESRYKRYAKLIELLGLEKYSEPKTELFKPEDENKILDTYGSVLRGKYIVIAPGARYKFKRWDSRKFAEVVVRNYAEKNIPVVLVGDSFDKEPCAEVCFVLTGSRVFCLDLSGKITVNQLAFVIKRAGLVLTNDSAPMHIANYYSVPVVGIFGPTDPDKYGLISDTSRIVKSKGSDINCVSVENVLKLANELL